MNVTTKKQVPVIKSILVATDLSETGNQAVLYAYSFPWEGPFIFSTS